MRRQLVPSVSLRHALPTLALGALGCASFLACGAPSSSPEQGVLAPGPTGQSSMSEQADAGPTEDAGTAVATEPPTMPAGDDAGTTPSADAGGNGVATGEAGAKGALPAGWLYTKTNKIYVSDGNGGGTAWMGRGVNMDDIFLCGANSDLSMSAPDTTLEAIAAGVVGGWKANFIRISLAMDSDSTVASWLTDPAQYKTPMTNVINSIGANPNTYVLVTLRSDASMILYDTSGTDREATGLPSNRTNTPDATKFPTGTDATYVALVDTFASERFVMFGLTNEPGGSTQTAQTDSKALTHAVGTIRAEEDRLGVPHHVISVQGSGWSGDVSYYASHPVAYDNLVYEVHGYPPSSANYTYSNIPVIIGEYGSLPSGSQAAFYSDLEQKQIPNLAWDFEPYTNCQPDLLKVNNSSTDLQASAWGSIVKSYLAAHASP
jgi:Cellulase (glycosyl hydrolase family 5)